MLKFLPAIILSLLFFQMVNAQKRDTSIYYMRNNVSVSNKIFADRIRLVISPEDSNVSNLYTIKDFYLNGKIKMVGTELKSGSSLIAEGPSVEYFPNGHRKIVSNYKDGQLDGSFIAFYPSGKLYFILEYGNNKLALIECQDSTGRKLVENGNGQWLNLESDYKKISDYGPVVDSMAQGKWKDHIYNDTVTYSTIYKNNVVVSTNNPHMEVGGTVFTRYRVEIATTFAGPGTFDDFINQNLKYPVEDKKNNVKGEVSISFIVEPDGTVSNVKAIDGPDEAMKAEAIRVVSLTHWHPHIHDGAAVDEQVTMRVDFSLDTNKVFNSVETIPQFRGSYIDFFEKNIKYPRENIDNHIQGKVIVTFVVEKDGKLSNIRILKSLSPTFDAEVLRVMSLSPKWIPATVGGKAVRANFTMPVYFKPNQ